MLNELHGAIEIIAFSCVLSSRVFSCMTCPAARNINWAKKCYRQPEKYNLNSEHASLSLHMGNISCRRSKPPSPNSSRAKYSRIPVRLGDLSIFMSAGGARHVASAKEKNSPTGFPSPSPIFPLGDGERNTTLSLSLSKYEIRKDGGNRSCYCRHR